MYYSSKRGWQHKLLVHSYRMRVASRIDVGRECRTIHSAVILSNDWTNGAGERPNARCGAIDTVETDNMRVARDYVLLYWEHRQ